MSVRDQELDRQKALDEEHRDLLERVAETNELGDLAQRIIETNEFATDEGADR
jgi:hypothetical protein